MEKVIYNKFDKELIKDLPQVSFPGKIVVALTAMEAEKAIEYLLTQSLLGIDTETRPSFVRGKQNKVSLLQVSTSQICFLFRLNYMGMTSSIIRLLEDENVMKVGLSLHDDFLSLHRLKAFKIGRFIDLQDLMKELGVEDRSLQKLYANFFHQKISKKQQLTNWENDVLTEKQKMYAATDAWACVNLYNEFNRLKETGNYQLIISKKEDDEQLQEHISEEK